MNFGPFGFVHDFECGLFQFNRFYHPVTLTCILDGVVLFINPICCVEYVILTSYSYLSSYLRWTYSLFLLGQNYILHNVVLHDIHDLFFLSNTERKGVNFPKHFLMLGICWCSNVVSLLCKLFASFYYMDWK